MDDILKAITEKQGYVLVDIEVSPNAPGFKISGYNSWRERIELRIKSLPQKGKANQEIVKELSKLTGKDVEIVLGLKSQQKTLKVYDITLGEFLKIINPFIN